LYSKLSSGFFTLSLQGILPCPYPLSITLRFGQKISKDSAVSTASIFKPRLVRCIPTPSETSRRASSLLAEGIALKSCTNRDVPRMRVRIVWDMHISRFGWVRKRPFSILPSVCGMTDIASSEKPDAPATAILKASFLTPTKTPLRSWHNFKVCLKPEPRLMLHLSPHATNHGAELVAFNRARTEVHNPPVSFHFGAL